MLTNILSVVLSSETKEPIKLVWDLRWWIITQFGLDESASLAILAGFALLCAVIPYLIGSINPAIIISNRMRHDDVRTHGSGNAGSTNMLRTYGKKLALLTFCCDLCKAALAFYFGRLLLGIDGAALAGFFVIFGHMFPIYYKFRGGKGVASLSMIIFLTSPITGLFLAVIFFIIVLGTRYVSMASVMCALLYPLILRAFAPYGLNVAMAVISACFVVYMHRENLKRILNNEESKLDLGQFKRRKKNKNGEDGHE